MAKIRTLNQLQEELDNEMSWRTKEISAFRLASKQKSEAQKYYIRAGVALIYAHWEGFIKTASDKYINFVSNRGLKHSELATCFCVISLKSKISTIARSNSSELNRSVYDHILCALEKRASISSSYSVDTGSNLSSSVFRDIAASIGIDQSPYASKFNFIDESLVRRRNKIAHGEYLDIDQKNFFDLVDQVRSIMTNFKTDIENAASLETYRRAAPQAAP
jgi:hypothetical protein